MSFFPTHELMDLLDATGPVVSLYMPTHRAGREMRRDPIRLRNLLSEARNQLMGQAMQRSEVEALLRPAYDLIDQTGFWRYQSDGLALFAAKSFFRHYCAPTSFKPAVIVGPRTHVKPLLSLLSVDARFYILALSQNEIRLLEASRFGVQQVELDDVPENLSEAIEWDDAERGLQWHSGTGKRTGARRMAMFHGHGYDNGMAHKQHILSYFQQIAPEIDRILADSGAPLVLAGVDYVLALYRQTSRYDHITQDAITGNQEETNDRELHRLAWRIVEPIVTHEREQAIARYHALVGQNSPLATCRLNQVLSSAYDGRIQTLFIALNIYEWGVFDKQSRKIFGMKRETLESTDLLDLAAAFTLRHHGEIYVIEPDRFPDKSHLAAILRY